MLLARSSTIGPTLFHASLSPYARSYKPPRGASSATFSIDYYDPDPKKLEWVLPPEPRAAHTIRRDEAGVT